MDFNKFKDVFSDYLKKDYQLALMRRVKPIHSEEKMKEVIHKYFKDNKIFKSKKPIYLNQEYENLYIN